MNGRTEALSKTYKPELSIVVYKADQSYGFYGDKYYLEAHQINEQGQLLEGKPLLQETIQGIVDTFYSEQKDKSSLKGVIPENLLIYKPMPAGKYLLAWYRPAAIKFFHFAKPLKLTSGKMWTPNLLYCVDGNDLFVYAMKKDGRPDEKTKLYRAPFHNIYDDGEVCLGNASVKKPSDKTFLSVIKYWEDMFWLSEFSHLNGASNPTKTELKKVYEMLLKSTRKKWADIDELKESKRQIKSILQ
jgi:PRTRC genetic system protein B